MGPSWAAGAVGAVGGRPPRTTHLVHDDEDQPEITRLVSPHGPAQEPVARELVDQLISRGTGASAQRLTRAEETSGAPVIDMVLERLRPGGHLLVATDHAGYAEHVRDQLARHPGVSVVEGERPAWRPTAGFEDNGTAAGR